MEPDPWLRPGADSGWECSCCGDPEAPTPVTLNLYLDPGNRTDQDVAPVALCGRCASLMLRHVFNQRSPEMRRTWYQKLTSARAYGTSWPYPT